MPPRKRRRCPCAAARRLVDVITALLSVVRLVSTFRALEVVASLSKSALVKAVRPVWFLNVPSSLS